MRIIGGDLKGKKLFGVVETITKLKYKICCREGKSSGEKGSVYMVDKKIRSVL